MRCCYVYAVAMVIDGAQELVIDGVSGEIMTFVKKSDAMARAGTLGKPGYCVVKCVLLTEVDLSEATLP